MMPHVAIESLVRLREKYQRMLAMRRVHDSGVVHDPRAEMGALAAEFPGALREIDELPLATIEARITALTSAIEQTIAVEPWMSWMVSYHGHLRAALRIKRMGLPRHDHEAALRALKRDHVAGDDEPEVSTFDREMLLEVLKPVTGRLNDWVFVRIAEHHGVRPEQVEAQLFPARRSLR